LVLIALIGIGYTVLPFVRDYPEPVLAWPGVMFILVVAGLWTLLRAVGSPWAAPFALAAAFLLPLGGLAIVAAVALTPKRDRWSLIHPLLWKAMRDTQPSSDRPVPVAVPIPQPGFPEWVRLAALLRNKKVADSVHVSRDRVTFRMARVAGLPRVWSRLLLTFGVTTLRVESSGRGIVSVDGHVYRLLGRPGPYLRYCQNIVDDLGRMVALTSEGRLEDAERLARV